MIINHKKSKKEMALQREIWLNHLVELLFPDNSFMMKSFNGDIFVTEGKFVHIPNEDELPGVKKNRTKGQAADVKMLNDQALKFAIDEYTSDPVLIPNAENYELAYDKRKSVLSRSKNAISMNVANGFIKAWSPKNAGRILETSGKSVKAHTKNATGNRKAFCRGDVMAAMALFNDEDIPQEGRYMLVDAIMHAQLLEDLAESERHAFLASADAQKGVLGELLSFKFMLRSKGALYDNNKAPKGLDEVGAATDCAAALAWHEDYVCRCLGEHEMFEDNDNPMFYGDIMSFLVRASGSPMTTSERGLLAIKQANV